MHRIRTRVVWVLVGVVAMTIGVIVWTTIPAWPIVGVAVATLVMAINTISQKLSPDACYSCGVTLKDQPSSEHGKLCAACGTVNMRYDGWLGYIVATTDQEKHAGEKPGVREEKVA